MDDGRRYLPTGDTCFVCGGKNGSGLHLRFYTYGDGEAHTDFTPADAFCGYTGIVHGGIMATALDEILGWAVSLRLDRFTVTGELTVRYVRPVTSNRAYHLRARAVEDKGRYWLSEGEVADAEGTVYVKATGKFFPLTDEQTQDVAMKLTYQPGDLPIFLESGSGA